MVKKRLIFVLFIATFLFILVDQLDMTNKKRQVTVQENEIQITLKSEKKGRYLYISSNITNISEKNKVVTFASPCSRGKLYRTSTNFNEVYKNTELQGCLAVIDNYKMKPNESLTTTTKYEKKKPFTFLDNTELYPGFKQEKIKIKVK